MNSENNKDVTKDYNLIDNTEESKVKIEYKMKITNTINKTDEMIDAEKKLTEELKK